VWRARPDLPIDAPARVGVVLHAYYADLLPELFARLRLLPVSYDLLITNATGRPIEVPADMGCLANVRTFEIDNHGRDILPLVSLVNAGHLDPYLVVLKIHTKRSQWRSAHDLDGDGARWRDDLLDALLGDEAGVAGILSSFAERPDLGLVTADGSVLGPEHWGDNQALTANLLRRLELILVPDELRFAAGSMYWIRGFALQGLRALNLSAMDFEPEVGQVNQTTAHAIERLIGVVVAEAGMTIHERSSVPAPASTRSWRRFGQAELRPRARVVPFYLPQFHPVPENDRWWGKGFTEWTNVSSAQPVYEGHYQPRLPTDLGFYDLRLDAVRVAQQELAREAGLAGFMYYHYWFAGRRLLDAPVWKLHASDVPQPFCLMWANENWTRRWDGREADVLIAQDYEHVPAEEFIDDILPLLSDRRYMTIGGRKILAVYRAGQVPDLAATVEGWRDRARRAGVGELYVLNVDVVVEFDGLPDDPQALGLDGSLSFPPHNHHWQWLPHQGLGVDHRFTGNILSYAAMAREAERRLRAGSGSSVHPGVMVAFDNTPRRQWESDVWYGSNAYTYRRWLATAVRSVVDRNPDERLVFINAWNEWAEGAILEPTDRHGRSFLLATRDVTLG
jgi:lipopolysaccharide biosynthesis protein